MQGGFLMGPEMTGLFIPDLPASARPQVKRSPSKTLFQTILPSKQMHIPRPKPPSPRPTSSPSTKTKDSLPFCPKTMGQQHANDILGKFSSNISFPLLPNRYNSIQEFGNKGKMKPPNTYPFFLFTSTYQCKDTKIQPINLYVQPTQ
jgi:hypothetical protein